MDDDTLWVILIARSGAEECRIPIADSTQRHALPLRHIAEQALRHDVDALAVLRPAADECCVPYPADFQAIHSMRATLGPIGVRLHDYILWQGDRCHSLRLAGKL